MKIPIKSLAEFDFSSIRNSIIDIIHPAMNLSHKIRLADLFSSPLEFEEKLVRKAPKEDVRDKGGAE